PFCSGNQVSVSNCLASLFPEVASEWHPAKNGDLTPERVAARSQKKVWWKCHKSPDHQWQATPANRTSGRRGCPYCAGKKPSATNSLVSRFPEIAAEWHPTKNGELTPDMVVFGSNNEVWWKCSQAPDHEWQATVNMRTSPATRRGCPRCNSGWTLKAIRVFVASLKEHLLSFTPAELYLLFQQNGLLQTMGKSKAFVKALTTGRFPTEEIEKFINGEPSLVDHFVQDPTQTLEALETNEAKPVGA